MGSVVWQLKQQTTPVGTCTPILGRSPPGLAAGRHPRDHALSGPPASTWCQRCHRSAQRCIATVVNTRHCCTPLHCSALLCTALWLTHRVALVGHHHIIRNGLHDTVHILTGDHAKHKRQRIRRLQPKARSRVGVELRSAQHIDFDVGMLQVMYAHHALRRVVEGSVEGSRLVGRQLLVHGCVLVQAQVRSLCKCRPPHVTCGN